MVYPTERLPFEDLTTIDERVDFVHGQLTNIETILSQVAGKVDIPAVLSTQLTAVQLAMNQLLEKEGMPTMAVVTREVPLKATVEEGHGARIELPSPVAGKITQIIRHWPPGCHALVDVAVGHKDTWVLPSATDTFVALDDATPITVVHESIEKGEMLWMIVNNTDSVNPHTITATFVIEGVE